MNQSHTAEPVQALEVNYHALFAGSPDIVVLFDVDNDCLIDVNRNAELLFGRPAGELLQTSLAGLCPSRQADGCPSVQAMQDNVAQVLAGGSRVFETTFLRAGGHPVECEMRLVPLPKPGRHLMYARIIDVTERKRAKTLLAGQNALLEMVASGARLEDTLDSLVRLIESQSGGAFCSVLLLDEDGRHMRCASGPRLPAAYMALLEGMEIGPSVGSCGTCMFRKETVEVSDILQDPLWAPYRELVTPFGLRACWSTPIFLNPDLVLGAFAMYYREVRSPSEQDRALIGVATHLAGIAIERTRREQELGRHRAHLEDLVGERTRLLTQAMEQAKLANGELAGALEHLRITQQELVRRDKLAALGALVAGIAHELNTPIGNSMMVASTMAERTRHLLAELPTGLRRSTLENYLGDAAEAESIVLRNLQRAANLVSSFKQIAVDRGSSQRRRFLLHQFVSQLLLPLCVPIKNTGFTVEQDIADDLVMDSYPGALGQVLASLFENSVLHGFEGRERGSITLRGCASGNGEILLTLADDGVGIPPANLQRVYDPFFTTRLGSGGSGLGLHIVHNIVTGVLGGRIEVQSQVAGASGTMFTLLLPAVAPPAG